MNEGLFRKQSLDRVSSPEQLNDYIQVTRPSVWIVLGAMLLLFVCALIWAVTASIPTTISAVGVSSGGAVTCYLPPEQADDMAAGMEATMDGRIGRVVSVAEIPLSASEATQALGSDYLAYALGVSEWNTAVTVSVPGAQDGIGRLSIITESVRPIEFLLN